MAGFAEAKEALALVEENNLAIADDGSITGVQALAPAEGGGVPAAEGKVEGEGEEDYDPKDDLIMPVVYAPHAGGRSNSIRLVTRHH
jgi:hypothetical protein